MNSAMQKIIKTTCAYCGVGCGIEAEVDTNKRKLVVKGDVEHPANWGKLCSKGSALGETLSLSARLLQPKLNGKKVHWDEALDQVAAGFQQTIAQYGANAVAFYGSGQLLTEDYYVANKLMKGFIGSANMDTNSRLCMASAVAGYKRAFGSDTVPCCYEDLEQAELVILVGSNLAWCHPISFGRIRAAKAQNPALKVVVIDPRVTDSVDIADLHLAIHPGTDVALFNGLLSYLIEHNGIDNDFIAQSTAHFEALKHDLAKQPNWQQAADLCQVDSADITTLYALFMGTKKVLTIYSQGVNQSSQGVDKVNAIINCHLATGTIGKPGMGPFSITGQPNAMGGREVGGLANQLAAHMDFNAQDIDRVGRFWQTENIAKAPGLTAIPLFEAIERGEIKAIWIMATNPVVSLPNADLVVRALQKCPLVVVSDCASDTDTLQYAHIQLPALGWSEKDGTVTNSERRISRQRALLPAAGEAKPDWWIIKEVAHRMGFGAAFNYDNPADIFREHVALSAFENNSAGKIRDFDLSALSDLSDQQYDALQPKQWPLNEQYPTGCQRLFSDGQFFTPSQKAQFIKVNYQPAHNQPSMDYPLILNTGRLRDQWHTMTRTALAPRLNQHKPEPFVTINPHDAEQYQLEHGEIALITSQYGDMLARVDINAEQRLGQLFVPMHWTNVFAHKGRMGAVVNPVLDPVSKQPESKFTPVKISQKAFTYYGFLLVKQQLSHSPQADYWVAIPTDQGYWYELAFAGLSGAKAWLIDQGIEVNGLSIQHYQDHAQGVERLAGFKGNQLAFIFALAKNIQAPALPERNWLKSVLAKKEWQPHERLALLSGLPFAGIEDTGKTVCACFNVGEKTICKAVKDNKLATYQQVGHVTQAGTNCGSCVPEIKRLLLQVMAKSPCS